MSYQQFGHVDRDERIQTSDELPPDEELPPRRGLLGIAVAAGVMAVFAGGLWFAYHEGAKHAEYGSAAAAPGQVPLIQADTSPVKVKPDKAGGMDIPDRDNPIYSLRPGSSTVEKLLPPPEAPQPRPTAPPPQVQAQAVPPAPLPAPGPPPPRSAPAAKPMLSPAQVAALAKPAAPNAAQPAAAGNVRIQLASLRTPDEARAEWARLKHAQGDLLGKYTAVAVRADLGERGVYYRIEAGPVGDKAAAQRLCRALKDRGLECSLVQ